MTKKHFISLADAIRDHNRTENPFDKFTESQLRTLARFCMDRNYNFNRERWFNYIAGECGPSGGQIK